MLWSFALRTVNRGAHMGLEKIKEEILRKSAAAEKEILAEASLKAEELKKEAARQIKQLEQDASHTLEVEMASLERRENSLASMEAQKMLFQAKKAALEAAYQDAFERIGKMPKKERELVIIKLLERAKKELEVHTVFVNDADKAWVGRYEIKPFQGEGIICETKDGKVRVDYTFTTLFGETKEKTTREVSKALFG
jgi:vacuolar-type H+-ATPase subunit E/Vma4